MQEIVLVGEVDLARLGQVQLVDVWGQMGTIEDNWGQLGTAGDMRTHRDVGDRGDTWGPR